MYQDLLYNNKMQFVIKHIRDYDDNVYLYVPLKNYSLKF